MSHRIKTDYPFGPIPLSPERSNKLQMFVSDGSPHPPGEEYMEAKRFVGQDGKPASIIDILTSLNVTDLKNRAN